MPSVKSHIFHLFGFSILGLLALACAEKSDALCDRGVCDDGGVVSPTDVSPTDAAVPPDPCVETPSDPKCLDESTALFVSAKSGNDQTGVGTRERPFSTIGTALTHADDTKKRIYVCEGTYPEKLKIQKAVSILGGFACDWSKGGKAQITPATGVPVTIVDVGGSVALAEVAIVGNADPQAVGDTAIAVFAARSKGVLLRNAELSAGPGTPGASAGDPKPNYTIALAPGGLSTASTAAAEAPICPACEDGNYSTAGRGAASGGVPARGDAKPTAGSDNSGGTVGGNCSDGKPGTAGSQGDAAEGAAQPGTLTATGWDATSTAKKGTNGNPGQGGGGGGSTAALGGGSGGCGSCGGTGGDPGGNGGSSFALLAFESVVTVEQSTLKTAAGGKGGKGAKGQGAQAKGPPGGGACNGGTGGPGAGGGGGGGGAGGHSVPIAHVGSTLITPSAKLTPGTPGDPGTGGDPGGGQGNPGLAGKEGAKGSDVEILPL